MGVTYPYIYAPWHGISLWYYKSMKAKHQQRLNQYFTCLSALISNGKF